MIVHARLPARRSSGRGEKSKSRGFTTWKIISRPLPPYGEKYRSPVSGRSHANSAGSRTVRNLCGCWTAFPTITIPLGRARPAPSGGRFPLYDRKIILIAGGYDKQIPSTPRPGDRRTCQTPYPNGRDPAKIEAAVKAAEGYREGNPQILHVAGMEEAVVTAPLRAARRYRLPFPLPVQALTCT